MKRSAVLLALLGVGMVSAATLKKNMGDNMRKTLATVSQDHDLSGVTFPTAADCNLPNYTLPPNNCNPNPPPTIPNQPPTPPTTYPTCPETPSTSLPGTGILTAIGSETAAERSVELVCYQDTSCL